MLSLVWMSVSLSTSSQTRPGNLRAKAVKFAAESGGKSKGKT